MAEHLQKCKELLEEVSKLCSGLDPSVSTSPTPSTSTTTSSMATARPMPPSTVTARPMPPSTVTARPMPPSTVTARPMPPSTVTAHPMPSLNQATPSSIWSTHNRLFGFQPAASTQVPSRKRTKKSAKPGPAKKKDPTWTRNFVCMADRRATKPPSSMQYYDLKKASLGEKRLTLLLGDTCYSVDSKLKGAFPKLDLAGGYTLASLNVTRTFRKIDPPYNTQRLKECTGQGKIFIIPMQKNLDTTPDIAPDDIEEDDVVESCMNCKDVFYLHELSTHLKICRTSIEEVDIDSSDYEDECTSTPSTAPPVSPPVTRTTPIPSTNTSSTAPPVSPPVSRTTPITSTDTSSTAPPVSPPVSRTTPIPSTNTSSTAPPVSPPVSRTTPITSTNTPPPSTNHSVSDSDDDLPPAFPEVNSINCVVASAVEYLTSQGELNPVEMLRYLQKVVVTGRALEIENVEGFSDGDTSVIFVDRQSILQTALDEVRRIEDKRLTLEVQFYGELAVDHGGPRKEFFKLFLQEVYEQLFKNGLKESRIENYHTVGTVMALSLLQNGKIPRFFEEWQLNDIFQSKEPHPCLLKVRAGMKELGIFQIAEKFPIFLHIFRRNEAPLMQIRHLQALIKPRFNEAGSNKRMFQGEVYSDFVKYLREVASGRRNNITLGKILQFVTGDDEEPLLGFKIQPCLEFVDAQNGNFLPTSNTCINMLKLPIPTVTCSKPTTQALHNLYDYAFANTYFGLS